MAHFPAAHTVRGFFEFFQCLIDQLFEDGARAGIHASKGSAPCTCTLQLPHVAHVIHNVSSQDSCLSQSSIVVADSQMCAVCDVMVRLQGPGRTARQQHHPQRHQASQHLPVCQ